MSLEYRLAPRDSAVDSPVGLAVSFPKSPLSTLLLRLPPFSVFFPLFLKRLLVPLVHHRGSRKQNGRTGGGGCGDNLDDETR